MILVYTTCKNKSEAIKISNYLVKNKLCACTNSFPINSVYRWKNKIIKDSEFVLIIKTKSDRFNIISKEIKKIHSYKTPCIMKIKVYGADARYLKWLNSC